MRFTELFLSSSPAAVFIVSLLKATVVLALVQWAVASAHTLSAAAKHLLLSFALAAFLVIPLLSLALPRVQIPVMVTANAPAEAVKAAPGVVGSLDATPAPRSPASVAPSSDRSFRRPTAVEMMALLWLAGVLLLLSRLVTAGLRLRSIVRNAAPAPEPLASFLEETRRSMGMHAPVRALVTPRVAVPMIWGISSGTLLLPEHSEDWSPEQLRATIVHELGHLQRLDYVALGLMNLVASLFWFHPQVWTARRRALTEGEHACDDLVLKSGARASEYASHLLSVARLMPRREPLAAILAMSRPTQLEGRMYAILSPSTNRKAVGGKLLMASAIGFMLLVAPLATFQLSAQAPVQAAPAVVASTIAQADSSGHMTRVEHHRTHNMNSRTETGTCADYQHQFDSDATVRAEQNLTYSGNKLDVDAAQNGGVSVRHATGNAFAITVCQTAGGLNDAAARQVLQQIRVQENNGKLTATGPEDGDWSVDLIITVPEGRAIAVKGENGPISFRGVNATIDASVQNGPLSLRDSRGEIKASAINGPVSISGVSGNVDLSTENGPLSIDLDGAAWVGGDLRAHVDNGPLSLDIPAGYQTGISLEAGRNAPFRCDGTICAGVENSDRRRPAPLKTTLGSGPARIFVQGGNGPVTVRQN